MTTTSGGQQNNVHYEHRNGYLFALISGAAGDVQETQANWLDIAATCKQGNYDKVLIVEEVEVELAFMDMFELAASLVRLGFQGIKIAFVDRKLDQYKNNKFGEDVAVNRGINGRVCGSIEEAEAWLLQK